jgi:hypothetical protein
MLPTIFLMDSLDNGCLMEIALITYLLLILPQTFQLTVAQEILLALSSEWKASQTTQVRL